ncbi:hypothetical protein PHYBLDRAFT_62902 [Phycomyces blakesleeanus NRRL 1555(-)]|uniref:Uncharacterized protein n=1 Tax=Phycomyces blakesleeanus (strain ATCC 8743b / DSM 1359 / FGSC 10004 / NBRC 33097 / NRRL 1555) TaxID=763407 RepID=A0A162XWQ6_PHYB8|nr:hypothetical protein PHYBLDRAFT_62902 [Phycomyces blakesleeanus NRRL 1555(-)]OAD76915.1 hypothetical protein PHYBLDRAFT_62902 [Phycomyces blakesleeanus NRRL 1555(-)]|eukprot:XP_018294955.1 hypothetical protein PHYBLDRAFT_62902 [Phycomyces blakesleeanus NRRL 1555(-)]
MLYSVINIQKKLGVKRNNKVKNTLVLLPSDASPSQCPFGLAKAISPKLLSTIKHGYEHDEPPSHEHIANQELSFHTSVIDMTILASPMYSLGLQINPFASGSILSTMVRIHDVFSFCLCKQHTTGLFSERYCLENTCFIRTLAISNYWRSVWKQTV